MLMPGVDSGHADLTLAQYSEIGPRSELFMLFVEVWCFIWLVHVLAWAFLVTYTSVIAFLLASDVCYVCKGTTQREFIMKQSWLFCLTEFCALPCRNMGVAFYHL